MIRTSYAYSMIRSGKDVSEKELKVEEVNGKVSGTYVEKQNKKTIKDIKIDDRNINNYIKDGKSSESRAKSPAKHTPRSKSPAKHTPRSSKAGSK